MFSVWSSLPKYIVFIIGKHLLAALKKAAKKLCIVFQSGVVSQTNCNQSVVGISITVAVWGRYRQRFFFVWDKS